jgi:hypothetical protein
VECVVAGEPTLHQWCPVCRLPSRVRVTLHIGDRRAPVAGVLEICPGCGTGHDRPSVAMTRPEREPRPWRPLVGLAWGVHRWACGRRGVRPLDCAHGDCRWPGRYRHEHEIAGEDGTWRYLFCSDRHRRAWAAEHRIRLT